MENKVTAISGWHEGMIDSIEGDFQFESNKPMNSVLWLENFNPNKILQSIVLRDAMGIVNDSALAPLPYNYTVYLPLNIIDGYLYPKYLGCMAFSTTRPLDHDILVVFVNGKYPAVDIVPYDESGENNAVTFDNLNETVFLCIDNTDEDIKVEVKQSRLEIDGSGSTDNPDDCMHEDEIEEIEKLIDDSEVLVD